MLYPPPHMLVTCMYPPPHMSVCMYHLVTFTHSDMQLASMELKVHELKDAMKFWKQKVPLSHTRLSLSLSLSLFLSGSSNLHSVYNVEY